MFNSIKSKIANILIKRKFLKKEKYKLGFNNFFNRSQNFLIIMPIEDNFFPFSVDIPRYLMLNKKDVVLIMPEHKYSELTDNLKYKIITYGEYDKTKLNLPGKSIFHQLKGKIFDVVIDLNFSSGEFSTFIANSINTNFCVGFNTIKNSYTYNLQIKPGSSNPEIAYRNMLETLKMF